MVLLTFRQLRESPGELVCAASVFAAGAFLFIYGLRYPVLTEEGVIGPGAMPVAAGTVLTAIATALLARALRQAAPRLERSPAREKTHPDLADVSDVASAGKPITVAGIFGVLVVTVVLAPYLGLIPMLSLAVFVLVFVFERESFLSAITLSAAGGIGSWLLFDWLFDIPLPVGIVWMAIGK